MLEKNKPPGGLNRGFTVCRKEMGFHEKRLGKAYFIDEMTGPAITRPASFDPKFTCTLYIKKSNKTFLKRKSEK